MLLGFSLSSEGLGLSLQQMIIAVPLGAVIGGTILSLAAWAGAYNGVPTVLAFRPAFGEQRGGAARGSLAVTLVGWAAVQLQAATETVAVAFEPGRAASPWRMW